MSRHESFLRTLWEASQPGSKNGYHLLGRAYVPHHGDRMPSVWLLVVRGSREGVTWPILFSDAYWVPLYSVAFTKSTVETSASPSSTSTSTSIPTCSTSSPSCSTIITRIPELTLDLAQLNAWISFALHSPATVQFDYPCAQESNVYTATFTPPTPIFTDDQVLSRHIRLTFLRLEAALKLSPSAIITAGRSRDSRTLSSDRCTRQLALGWVENVGSHLVYRSFHGYKLSSCHGFTSRAVVLEKDARRWHVVYWNTQTSQWDDSSSWKHELCFVFNAFHTNTMTLLADTPSNTLVLMFGKPRDVGLYIDALKTKFPFLVQDIQDEQDQDEDQGGDEPGIVGDGEDNEEETDGGGGGGEDDDGGGEEEEADHDPAEHGPDDDTAAVDEPPQTAEHEITTTTPSPSEHAGEPNTLDLGLASPDHRLRGEASAISSNHQPNPASPASSSASQGMPAEGRRLTRRRARDNDTEPPPPSTSSSSLPANAGPSFGALGLKVASPSADAARQKQKLSTPDAAAAAAAAADDEPATRVGEQPEIDLLTLYTKLNDPSSEDEA